MNSWHHKDVRVTSGATVVTYDGGGECWEVEGTGLGSGDDSGHEVVAGWGAGDRACSPEATLSSLLLLLLSVIFITFSRCVFLSLDGQPMASNPLKFRNSFTKREKRLGAEHVTSSSQGVRGDTTVTNVTHSSYYSLTLSMLPYDSQKG